MPNLYALWSIERVAVLYNLETIADKDWYRWASQLLVAHQQPGGVVHPHVDTAPGVHHTVRERLDRLPVAGVAVHEDAVGRRVAVEGDARHAGAAAGKRSGDSLADAARSAGNHHAPVAHVESGGHAVTV